ncbi:MAG: DUF4124 domain-containing protein [Kangiella sp.]|jgi:hypothetical protein|nr:DUF4124 domain-containing protein [Kangiella sp.]MCW9027664.1 DUF4124 domain-containing protein [Kangiella sp.]
MANIKSIVLTAILGLGISAMAIASQPIYKWKDDKGNIKYTQTKPPHGVSYETINQRVSNSNSTDSASGDSQQEPPVSEQQDKILAEQNAQKKSVEEQNKEIARKNCEIANNNLEVLESKSRIRIEENGENRFLTDTERESRLKQARENVKKYCEK